MLYICIFSNKLDLNQAIRVSHKLHKSLSKITPKGFMTLTPWVDLIKPF